MVFKISDNNTVLFNSGKENTKKYLELIKNGQVHELVYDVTWKKHGDDTINVTNYNNPSYINQELQFGNHQNYMNMSMNMSPAYNQSYMPNYMHMNNDMNMSMNMNMNYDMGDYYNMAHFSPNAHSQQAKIYNISQ